MTALSRLQGLAGAAGGAIKFSLRGKDIPSQRRRVYSVLTVPPLSAIKARKAGAALAITCDGRMLKSVGRLTNRPNSGTSYRDMDGIVHAAYELVYPELTVASAWACLRKCWRGFKIAKSHQDNDMMVEY